ncbi:transglutaminase family protein [Flavobacteriaceae bacterium TP-CH-4]|uniref:Transglutaminase family protein n=1 Tax=Pelagihabitans pacificus TaxID=2696054 RepID=A0A967EDD0_9FLAO|nr:transglutaminase domain-containing protein [Pelagihabitans pacificus]NHF59208.1 transglutaminase family protein [Pelagihabitans pacificus]
MALEYSINYVANNRYENPVKEAHWQFTIIPEANSSQEQITVSFQNSLHIPHDISINGYGFQTLRVSARQPLSEVVFEASFKLMKKEVNPFDFQPEGNIEQTYKKMGGLDFKIDFEPFLRCTRLTNLPMEYGDIFRFDFSKAVFDNLIDLNKWTYEHLYFKTNVTNVDTTLKEIIEKRHGVCQDFTHLFCTLARANGVPARYVSGYLHQGNGYFGDSQMHAWAETYIPNIGWVGFDPTNNLLANTNHIKVAHGKDYNDCSPLKGVVYTVGTNETSHTVKVKGEQQ